MHTISVVYMFRNHLGKIAVCTWSVSGTIAGINGMVAEHDRIQRYVRFMYYPSTIGKICIWYDLHMKAFFAYGTRFMYYPVTYMVYNITYTESVDKLRKTSLLLPKSIDRFLPPP